jgi:AraC-like DNA-binding protein
MPLSHLVRRALRPMVFTGTATESAAARLFSLHPRSLRRQLSTDGETFLGLLNETRLGIAQQLLRDTDLCVAEIAVAMHYSDATALARAFRARVGMSPTGWRKRERTRPQGT